MRILVVAPDHHDLPNAASEIAAIDRHHETVVLRGVVNDRDVALAVDEDGFEGIWWITHGSTAGVLLSDGLLPTLGVGQYVRKSGASLCVLNTCESEDVALMIIAGGRADMICTIAPVPNNDAVRLGSLLAGELAESDDYHAAYEVVAPPGGLYRYLRAETVYRRRLMEPTGEQRLKRLEQTVYGDNDLGLVGLAAQYKHINTDLRILKWLMVAVAIGSLMFVVVQYNQPEPRTVVIVATPTPIYMPYVPPEIR